MSRKPNELDLHAMANAILRDHAALTKQIKWLLQRRIELEKRLEEIDAELGHTPRPRPSVLRLDSRHTGPN